MSEKDLKKSEANNSSAAEEEYSLNDDRRVKVLTPGAMVAKRFFRNRLAIVGMVMLIAMFLFSFVGGLISPYDENQQFYTYEYQSQQYAGVVRNSDFRYLVADGQEFGSTVQAYFLLYYNNTSGEEDFSFEYKSVAYDVVYEGTDFFSIYSEDKLLAMAFKDIVNSEGEELSFLVKYGALKAYVSGETSFEVDGVAYTMDEDGNIGTEDGTVVGYISRFVVTATENGVTITRQFKEELDEAISNDETEFIFTDADGETHTYDVSYEAFTDSWTVNQQTETYVYDSYSSPSFAHWLGTDRNGMDMLTRLMYGGRVSLVIGFIVVIIAGALGIVLGGLAGYFGGWVDNLIMRIVDVFWCIPSTPLMIILGSAMDAMNIDPQIRMLYLMLLLGFLSWPSVARLVRGQILSLREQEFMAAAEACGIRSSRRIFRHLIPNVMPQLIVSCTMMLGSTIITEATLSFLGLGVKFPFASWGNIINDVNSTYVMTNYWFIWIPAGLCLLITVLGFNFVGDGLRDAFDPKMKR
ncbi:MAG: ABC transporter permease [Clostridiales bacterium]|nr:ABC transporter permease [Clostridiales bacterium]